MPKIIAPPANELNETIEKRPIITTCPHCQYTISYTEDEVERLGVETVGVYCPNCNRTIETDHIVPFTYPDSFYHFGKAENSVHLTNEEVQRHVDIVRRRLQEEREIGEYSFSGSGDTMVFGFKMEDEDLIFVAKNYWEDSVAR